MAGRAGRRGKDDRGYALLCFDPSHPDVPHYKELVELLDSSGQALESKLKVNYRTCLNVLKNEAGAIGSLLQNSFFANEDTAAKLSQIRLKKKLEPLYERAKEIQCVYGVPS